MSLFKIIIHHGREHLFYEFETNWLDAKNLAECKKKVRKLLKLKIRFANKGIFIKEKNKIESILIKDEIYKENNTPYTRVHDLLVFPK